MCYPFPPALRNYGDHVREHRLSLGWTQKRAAEELGVSEEALRDWELGNAEPKPHRIGLIAAFLGYQPSGDRYSAAQLVGRIRRLSGLSLGELAKRTGTCADTLANLAKGRYQPSRRTYDKLTRFAADLDTRTRSHAPEGKYR